ncbi:MAG: hypothetical protein CVV58_04965, partial [Tenericutes bacterium HGW-Tenericutes-3]
AEYRLDHATALALTVGTVQISNKAIVQAALDAYELLTIDAQAQLTAEKALLDSLSAKIVLLEATAAVVTAESTYLQADHDQALIKVNALPASADKTSLLDRLTAVQDTINTQKAAAVQSLIAALPSTGAVVLSNQAQIEAARTAYNALTSTQKALVTNLSVLVSVEAEYAALVTATNAVVTAETSKLQADVTIAQALVTALSNGTAKTALQTRLTAVQNIIDVNSAKTLIQNYFAANSVVVTRLNSNSLKETAFRTKANEVVAGLGVTITITNTNYISRTNTIYTIQIVKGSASVTMTVSVTFTR